MNQQLLTTNQELFPKTFRGKRVWLSGHTGFKGSWLSEWLLDLGAIVHGYALAPDTTPALFEQLGLASRLKHEVADIRDAEAVHRSIHDFRPDFVIHMAAQPLVRRSYSMPVETYETNVMGTINVLEALRGYAAGSSLQVDRSKNPNQQRTTNNQLSPVTAIIVTTDKVYENHESGRAYEEKDPLGGHDPYSSSKAMAEIAVSAYRHSYFQNGSIRLASARAGNVIGGGDWAEDRIVPDAMRALDRGEPIAVRNPKAVRPWQHVLEPLGGYLTLAALLATETTTPNSQPTTELCSAFNFGPGPDSNRTVSDLVDEILKTRQGAWTDASDSQALHEATLLNLSIEQSEQLLGWKPKWAFEETVNRTVTWYAQVHAGTVTPMEITRQQIAEYQGALP